MQTKVLKFIADRLKDKSESKKFGNFDNQSIRTSYFRIQRQLFSPKKIATVLAILYLIAGFV